MVINSVCLFDKEFHFAQDQGDQSYAEPPAPQDDNVRLEHYDATDFYVLPFSLYAIGIR